VAPLGLKADVSWHRDAALEGPLFHWLIRGNEPPRPHGQPNNPGWQL